MYHNTKQEKYEPNILSSNLVSRNNIDRLTNVQRPDTLEIKVKPDNIVSKAGSYQENANSWSGDSLDNFILQIRNANNTPSPITPNSFFNPSDVTQDQEQFADALTVHLNKIKEDYKSGIESADPPYLSNIIQISSINPENPISIATVSLGDKVYFLNHNIDSNDNQCLNYSVVNLPGNISGINHQQAKISQYQSQPTIICAAGNLQFSPFQQQNNNIEIAQLFPENSEIIHGNIPQSNFLKTPEGIVYTRVPDSSQSELLNQLNSLTSSYSNIANFNRDCLSASSNDSSFATNDSCHNKKDCSSNGGSKLLYLKEEDKGGDDVQRRLERKRARNRDAARKCRDRKNSLITSLEQKYARQTAEKDLIREKLIKSLEEIRRLTEYISKHDPHSKFANFSNFLNEIKIEELTETDIKDLNLL